MKKGQRKTKIGCTVRKTPACRTISVSDNAPTPNITSTMATRSASPQAPLFRDEASTTTAVQDAVTAVASSEATEVSERALRREDGDLRSIRYPVEMAALEPQTKKLTFLSHRLWLFLVSYALESAGHMTALGVLWRVPMATLQADVKFDSNDTAHLKASLRECQKILVEWAGSARDKETGEVRTWTSTQLLGSAEFVIDEHQRKCLEWSFPPALLRQMREHKHFFETALHIVNLLSRQSSLALFKVISRYKTSPSGLTERRPWRNWIAVLTGESAEAAEASARLRNARKGGGDDESAKHGKYKEYRYFNRDVVAPAVKELNRVLDDVWVEAIQIKVGGRVSELQFKVTPREGFKARNSPLRGRTEEIGPVIAELTSLGLTKTFATRLCTEHPKEVLLETAAEVRQRMTEREIQKPPAFFVALMKQKLEEALKAGSAPVAESPLNLRPLDVDAEAEESLNAYRSELQQAEKQAWDTVPAEVQADYLKRFADGRLKVLPAKLIEVHTDSGIDHPAVKSIFFKWLAQDRAGDRWNPDDRQLLAFERARARRPAAEAK